MTRILRKVTKKFFIAVNIIAVVVFLAACCNNLLHPGKYWYVALLGVGFPFLVLLLLFFIIFWLFFKSRWKWLSIAALLIGWFQVDVLFAFHPFNSFDNKKAPGSFRVMQWNVSRLDEMNKHKHGENYRQKIFDYIHDMDPDILCMEEFIESNNPKELPENISYFTRELKYPYYYFARDHRRWDGLYEHGVVIFSRYPIADTLRIRYSGPDSLKGSESLIHTDIDINGQRVRVFATHLQSLRFDGNDYGALQRIAKVEDSAVTKSMGIIKKFRTAYNLRSTQAELVRRELDESPYPEILCGDFNDVPNSFTYFKIRGGRNDVFLKKGFGIGRSFASLSPTLRIDYILADTKLEIRQFRKTKLPYSDHYPLVADFNLPVKN